MQYWFFDVILLWLKKCCWALFKCQNKISAPKLGTLIEYSDCCDSQSRQTVHPKSTETSVKEQRDGVAHLLCKSRQRSGGGS